MSEQKEAEQHKLAAILKLEGDQQAAINQASGRKQAAVNPRTSAVLQLRALQGIAASDNAKVALGTSFAW
jgi:regulator of protease activity HflC (stomatin/prohibitin superfamily)